MKHWRILVVVAIAVILIAIPAFRWQSRRAQKQRQDSYQELLRSYSQKFPAGSSRKLVEDYVRSKAVQFQQGLISHQEDTESKTASSDFIRIGEEPAPWYCSSEGVYIAFDFSATERHARYAAADSDLLKRVRLDSWGEGCL
jgi:hypothetical protein